MRLEQLYPNFAKLSHEDQMAYVAVYRLRRAEDLAQTPTTKKKASHSETSKIDLSPEEKAVMKMLGLKQKDVIALRAAVGEPDQEENGGVLFQDESFEEE